MTKRVRASHKHYTRDERILAVTAMLTVGKEHPFSIDAFNAARDILGVNLSTTALQRWYHQHADEIKKQQPTLNPDNLDTKALISATQADIIQQFAEVRGKVLQHLNKDEIIGAMSGRDSGVVVGIMNDHLIKMVGLSTEEQTAVKRLRQACERAGYDMLTIVDDMCDTINHSVVQTSNVIDIVQSDTK